MHTGFFSGVCISTSHLTGFTYNIHGGAYQLSNIAHSLAPGNFTIAVKDMNGCTTTAIAGVGTATAGPLFASVRPLMTNRCSCPGCHMNGGNAAGYNSIQIAASLDTGAR